MNQIHLNVKPHVCPICQTGFVLQSLLKLHMYRHSDNIPKKFVCNECGKNFAAKGRLSIHMKRHGQDRPYACEICFSSFKVAADLKQHMKNHLQEKPYKCNICLKGYIRKADYARHSCKVVKKTEKKGITLLDRYSTSYTSQLTSDNEKKNIEVNRSASNRSDIPTVYLAAAATANNILNPFECNICKRRLKTNDNLIRHMKRHSQMRPHVCDICKSSFKVMEDLIQHKLVHLIDKPFKCVFCPMSFVRKSQCDRHVNNKHNIMSVNVGTTSTALMTLSTAEEEEREEEASVIAVETFSNTTAAKTTLLGNVNCDSCGVAFTDESALHIHKTSFSARCNTFHDVVIDRELPFDIFSLD